MSYIHYHRRVDHPWFRFRLVGSLLTAVMVSTGLATLLEGCATRPPPRRFSASVFHSARHVGSASMKAPRHPAAYPPADESATVIVEQLHAAGFHFGTDGSTGALWGYMRTTHRVIRAADARAGDFVFFDTRSREGEDRGCGDRVGIIESVDPDGRITFVEIRAGQPHRGYADPSAPLRRRRFDGDGDGDGNDSGDVLNSFLRPKKIGDPDGTRYFAGEMLCAVARVAGH